MVYKINRISHINTTIPIDITGIGWTWGGTVFPDIIYNEYGIASIYTAITIDITTNQASMLVPDIIHCRMMPHRRILKPRNPELMNIIRMVQIGRASCRERV